MGIATVEAVIEQSIPWRERPGERKRQLEWQWSYRSNKIFTAQQSVKKRVSKNADDIKKSKDNVDLLLKGAYEALLEAVKALLKLSDAQDPVDNATFNVVPALDIAITRFKEGEAKTDAEAKALIAEAGACMNDGDIIQRGIKIMKDWENTLSSEVDEVTGWVDTLCATSRAKKRTVLERYSINGVSEQAVEQQYDEMMIRKKEADELGLRTGKGIPHVVGQEVTEALNVEAKRAGRKARRGLALKNEMTTIRNRIHDSQFDLQTVTNTFHEQHRVMQDAWSSTTKIWAGLMRLKSNVEDPDFKSTRDSSLKQILTLIKEDDVKLESSWPSARAVENSIYAEINGKLGEGAVKRIVDGNPHEFDSPY